MNELEQRVAKLEAVEDIRRLKVAYAAGCDRHYDAAAIAALFTADGSFDGGQYGGGFHQGTEAVQAYFQEAADRIPWALHYVLAPDIRVADDLETAEGVWYLWELATVVDAGETKGLWIAGRYYDKYRRVNGEWKFESVRLESDMITPFDDGWVKTQFYIQSGL